MIKAMRKKLGMTQEQFACCLGVTQQSVASWENGKTLPRPALLPKIADVLGCTVDELLRSDAEKTKNPA